MELSTATDQVLLSDFSQHRTAASLEELIRRYGKLVHNASLRVLKIPRDAEHATQAVFLTLARKASSAQHRQPLAGWLYELTWSIAKNAREVQSVKRQSGAGLQPAQSTRISEWSRVEALLDAELNAIPAKHRLPLVLFHLQGCSQRDACRVLECNSTALESALTHSRELLQERLKDQGVIAPEGRLAMLLSNQARTSDLPPGFAGQTAAMALQSSGQELAAEVASLSDCALKSMFVAKLKTAALIFLTAAVVGTGLGLSTWQALANEQAEGQDPSQIYRRPSTQSSTAHVDGPRL